VREAGVDTDRRLHDGYGQLERWLESCGKAGARTRAMRVGNMRKTTSSLLDKPMHMRLRKITKNRGSFPRDEALMKLFYLARRNISRKWAMPIRDWKAALTRFTIQFEVRMNNV